MGFSRINRNIPATTMVLLCSSADTGVGPSMAAGSHGCRPNWADLPAAASKAPASSKFVRALGVNRENSSDKDQVLNSEILREKKSSIPMSPIRLYIIA